MNEWLNIVLYIMPIIFSILFLITILFQIIGWKIHNSYHKGYNEARKDKINYFSTVRDLETKFNEILENCKKDNVNFSIITAQSLINYKQKLTEYKQKY